MPPMSLLEIDPAETLCFRRSAVTTSPNRMLKLTNVHSGNVAYKVKTTAPKSYLVRPSCGTLKPNQSTEVQIILQPQQQHSEPNSHRFLVQAVSVKEVDPVSRDDWAMFPKELLQEQRLNVTLEDCEVGADRLVPTNDTGSLGLDANANASRASAEGVSDLKVKYDELVQYTLMLEKEKKKLEGDLANLSSAKHVGGVEGFSRWTLIVVALLAFLLPYAARLLRGGSEPDSVRHDPSEM